MRCVIPDFASGYASLTEPPLVLQRVVFDRESQVRDLYWSVERPGIGPARLAAGGGLEIPSGGTVSFGGYFNSFFEVQWRAHTRLADLALRLRLAGSATLRVWRESGASGLTLLAETVLTGGPAQVALAESGGNLRSRGRIFFDLTPLDGAAVLEEAAYVSPAAEPLPVGLVLVFCTFNRERELTGCLDGIAADAALVEALTRIVVVNQGRRGLAAPDLLGEKVIFVEQANFGGAGGFTRGLIEALDTPAASHACFVDDDVRIEPESLFRMIAFFRLARPGLALGGHMLDAIRQHVLYEAGAVVDRANWRLLPLSFGLDLREPATLETLGDILPMDYNGWWLFGFPLAIAREIGLPLPCFIRGDDVEYGLRLNAAGFATVGLPGVAVWHEPFYLKIGNWQLYYEVRNQLAAAALHLGFRRRDAAVAMLKHFLVHLLTFRYFSSAMILRGIEDFLRGPDLLSGDPGRLHAALLAIRAQFPEGSIERTRPLQAGRIAGSPRSRAGFVIAIVRNLTRNLLRPTRVAEPSRIAVDDLVWFRLEHAEHVAVDAYWNAALPAYARSREHCRVLAWQAVRVLWRLWRDGERVAADWRAAAPMLTAPDSWRRYLGLRKAAVREQAPA